MISLITHHLSVALGNNFKYLLSIHSKYNLLYILINCVILSQLTKHTNSSLPRQSAAYGLGFTAVHLAVVHLHIVDPEGAVREYLKTRVLEKKERERSFKFKCSSAR